MSNRFAPALLAGSLAITIAGAPLATAGDDESQSSTKLEQYTETAQVAINDAWLQGKLESALFLNEHLDSFAIDTEVNSGVAFLTGAVESDVDRELAGEIAESIEGIGDVENKLVVDDSIATAENAAAETRKRFRQKVADATLTARVKSELLVNGSTSGLAINVDTEDGAVTLSGKVSSDEEKDLAGQIASNIDGTESVENKLTVESGS